MVKNRNGIISFEAAGWRGPVVLFSSSQATAYCRAVCLLGTKEQNWKDICLHQGSLMLSVHVHFGKLAAILRNVQASQDDGAQLS